HEGLPEVRRVPTPDRAGDPAGDPRAVSAGMWDARGGTAASPSDAEVPDPVPLPVGSAARRARPFGSIGHGGPAARGAGERIRRQGSFDAELRRAAEQR